MSINTAHVATDIVKLPQKGASLAAHPDNSYSAAVIRDPDTPTPDRSHHHREYE
jgi:hypothetical protein